MKLTLIAALLAFSSIAQAQSEDAVLFDDAKAVVSAGFKDPSSAQFRNLRTVELTSAIAVCGEVNAKNSYGGYVGFVQFSKVNKLSWANIKNGSSSDRLVDVTCRTGEFAHLAK